MTRATGSSSRGGTPSRSECPAMHSFDTILLFKDGLYGSLVIALACSVLGVYVVFRRIVFVGAAMAELSSAGIGLALFLAGRGATVGFVTPSTATALLMTVAVAVFF